VCAELHINIWDGTGRIRQGTVVYEHVTGSVEVVKMRWLYCGISHRQQYNWRARHQGTKLRTAHIRRKVL